MSDQYTDTSIYGYTPTASWCIAFIVLFSVSAAVHSLQALRSKYWIIYPTLVLGALIEVLGWAARYWSSQNVLLLTPFLMQICTLTLAPVFFSAYCYAVLGSAINKLGQEYSVLRPNWYFIVFITADLISLILQAVGGGQAASSAATSEPTSSATTIMVVGIIFQLATMGIFIALGIDFVIRAKAQRPYAFQVQRIARLAASRKDSNTTMVHADSTDSSVTRLGDVEQGEKIAPVGLADRKEMKRWWIMAFGVAFASAMIFVRGIYRSIELVQGWEGFLISHEIYQNCLDGIPMILAVAVFNVVNPLFVLPKKEKWGPYY